MYYLRSLAALMVCAALASGQTAEPKQRIKAIRDLAKLGSESIPKVEQYLDDPVQEVRAEAVKAIDEIGGPRSIEPLVKAAGDNDPEVQIRATDGLVNFYSPGYLKTGLSGSLRRVGTSLRAKFTDTNDLVIDPYIQVRPEVITALGKLARGGSSMESRANAARALGILRGRAAIPDLIAALRSKDDQVMYESLIALQKIRDESAGPQIVFLLRDLNDKVQIAAIETAGLLRAKDAVPTLRDLLTHEKNTKVKRAALTALAMLPDPQNRLLFEQFLNDRDEGMRAAAAEGFARLKNPADLPMILQKFNSESKMNPRLSLAFAAVSLGQNALTEFSPLRYLVNTLNSTGYRGVAQPFLTELARDPGIRRTLYSALNNASRDEKIYLGQIFAITGDHDTVKYLETLAADTDTNVASEGVRSLKTLKARL
jgi:HEAT repeat protein